MDWPGVFTILFMIKRNLTILSLMLFAGIVLAQTQNNGENAAFKNARDQASYAFGMNIGRGWKEGQLDLNSAAVIQGLQDALAGQTLLTEAEMRATLAKFGRDLQVIQQQRREQLAETNRLAGEAFLSSNKTNQDVVCLPDGLQYKIIAPGKGTSPDLTNWVTLKYRGTRLNGTEFERSPMSSPANNFSLHNVIQGWSEALQKMKPGAKWQLFVPPSLAYGKDGSPEAGPNETVIYELELVSILPGPPQPTAEDLKNERDPNGD